MCNESAQHFEEWVSGGNLQRCLAIELERVGLEFEREKEHDIFYDRIRVGMRRADFVVEYPKNN